MSLAKYAPKFVDWSSTNKSAQGVAGTKNQILKRKRDGDSVGILPVRL